MTTITKERLIKIQLWRETYGPGSNVVLPAEEAEELARIALASLEAEPVYQVYGNNDDTWSDVDEEEMIRLRRDGEDTRTLYTAPPSRVSVPDYPETLPCPVMLEPGLKFGKGVPTRTMLGALRRRAEYYAELEAMTPEQRAEHDARMKKFAAMLQGAENAESRCTIQAAPVLDSLPKIADSRCGNAPVIPDKVLSAIRKVARIRADFDDFDGDRRGIGDCLDEAEQELIFTINKHASVIAAAPQQEV